MTKIDIITKFGKKTEWNYEEFVMELLKYCGYYDAIDFIKYVYNERLIDFDWYCYLLGVANDFRIKKWS